MKQILLILSTIVFLTANIQAEYATKESVTKLYVATFERAPDSAGLDYWINSSGLSLEDIASSFFDQPETQALYPNGYGDYDFILAIYKNLFARDPDSDGGDYWQDELSSGAVSKSVFILAVVNGATGDDASILDNKTQVGLKFVEDGLEDTTLAKDVMQDITSNKQTMVDSFNKMNNVTINNITNNYYYTNDLVEEEPINNYIDEIFIEEDTGLMWQDDEDAKSITKPWVTLSNSWNYMYDDTSGDTATTYCENLSLGGYYDWRLPTKYELLSLSYQKYELSNVEEYSYYWSSSEVESYIIEESGNWAETFEYAYMVDFDYGVDYQDYKDIENFVRCVREE